MQVRTWASRSAGTRRGTCEPSRPASATVFSTEPRLTPFLPDASAGRILGRATGGGVEEAACVRSRDGLFAASSGRIGMEARPVRRLGGGGCWWSRPSQPPGPGDPHQTDSGSRSSFAFLQRLASFGLTGRACGSRPRDANRQRPRRSVALQTSGDLNPFTDSRRLVVFPRPTKVDSAAWVA